MGKIAGLAENLAGMDKPSLVRLKSFPAWSGATNCCSSK